MFASRSLTVPVTAITNSLRSDSDFFVERGVALGVEDDLGNAGAVAEIDEEKIAVIAAAVDPSHEYCFFAGVRGAESAAHVSASKIA